MLHGSPIPKGRRSKRIVTKKRANLVIDQSGARKCFPVSLSIGRKRGSDCGVTSDRGADNSSKLS